MARTKYQVRVYPDEQPFFARIVLRTQPWNAVPDARKIVEAVLAAWPRGVRSKYLLAPGGFLDLIWPCALQECDCPRNPPTNIVDALVADANRAVDKFLAKGLREQLQERSRYLSIGVDALDGDTDLHSELVCLLDLETGAIWWTGKSYPTPDQQNKLVRVTDLGSHCVATPDGPVLLLGCHDLNLFSPRAEANAMGWRQDTIVQFRALALAHGPTVVLQHPHTADTPGTWRTAWGGLVRTLPSVRRYASSGAYWFNGKRCRGKLEDVLLQTKLGPSIDFVVGQG